MLFNWVQITTISYLATALLSPQGTAIIPWWFCGMMAAVCCGGNYFFPGPALDSSKRFVFNGLSYLFFSFLPIAFFEYWVTGRMWPMLLPGSLVFLTVWSWLVYASLKPLAEKTKVRLWEMGIIASGCGMLLSLRYRLGIPYSCLAPLVMIASGLLSQGLKKREESSGVTRTNQVSSGSFLTVLFLIIACIVSLFSVSGLALQHWIGNSGLKFLSKMMNWYKMANNPVERRRSPFLELLHQLNQRTAPVSGNSHATGGPLWLMLLLWTLLALTVLLILAVLVLKWIESNPILRFKEFLFSFQSIRPNTIRQNDDITIWTALRKFPGAMLCFIRKWLSILKRATFHLMSIPPSDTNALFSYYLWWGKYIGLKKHNAETPREYLERLQKVFEGTDPVLVDKLTQLTLVHEKQFYGGAGLSITKQKFKEIFSTLNTHKRRARKEMSKFHNSFS